MPLTPEDVASKRFTPTRFKTGYDEEEVDAFLDEVEAELRRLLGENAELRQAVQVARAEAESAKGQAAADPATGSAIGGINPLVPPVAPSAAAPIEPATPTPAAPEPAVAAQTAREEPQEQALRTLLLAQRTADEAIAQAKAEAEQIVSSARNQATMIEQEASRQHAAAMVDFQRQRNSLETTIDGLRAFEREYRTRLKAYLESQLRDLSARQTFAPAGGPPPSAAENPVPPTDEAATDEAATDEAATARTDPMSDPVPHTAQPAEATDAEPPTPSAQTYQPSPFTVAPPVVPPPTAHATPEVDLGFITETDPGSDVPSGPIAEATSASTDWQGLDS